VLFLLSTQLPDFTFEGQVPVGFSPSPFPTSPLFLRSMCQLSVSPALFFNVNANTAFACLMASLRSASEDLRVSLIVSKAAEEGKASFLRDMMCGLWFIECYESGIRRNLDVVEKNEENPKRNKVTCGVLK